MTSPATMNNIRNVSHHGYSFIYYNYSLFIAILVNHLANKAQLYDFFYVMTLSVSQAVYCQTTELLINWKGFRSGYGLDTVPSQHMPEGNEEYHEKVSQGGLCPCQDLKKALLHHPAWYIYMKRLV
jgi:hypothetical protein